MPYLPPPQLALEVHIMMNQNHDPVYVYMLNF